MTSGRRRLALPLLMLLLSALLGLGAVHFGLQAQAGRGADASVEGVYRSVDGDCPDGRVEYVVDGRTLLVDSSDSGPGCAHEDGESTSPQRVFYETADPTNAVVADPGGPGAIRVLREVVAAAFGLGFLASLGAWVWLYRRRPGSESAR